MVERIVTIPERGASLLGGVLRSWSALAGGDLSGVFAIELADGRRAVVKEGPDPRAEAQMLVVMGRADVPVPDVLACGSGVLVLEWLDADGHIELAWNHLGRVLERLHSARYSRYGWHEDYAFRDVAILNAWSDDWPEFWGERRLLSQLPHLPRSLQGRVAALVRDLPNRLPGRPDPSLLHGDLWTGNVLVAENRIKGLIDPACYYGDREVDFAMLGLFSRPGPDLFSTVGSLEPGHRERQPIYQLWPALVHWRLFGSAYLPMVDQLLTAAGV